MNDQQIRVLTPSEIMRTLPSFPNQDIACNFDATTSNVTISTNSISVTAVSTTCTNVLVANNSTTELPNISNQIQSSNHTASTNANTNNANMNTNTNYNSCSINQSTISASSSNDNHHYHTNNNNNHNPAIIQCLPSSPTSTTTITTSVALKTVRVEPKNKNVKNMFYQLSYIILCVQF